MRLLFLNRSFWPDPEATGQFLTELCDDLSREHEITVIAGPSYHRGSRSPHLFTREAFNRVSVIRTWGAILPKRWLLFRLINLATYYALAALAALRCEKPDVLIAATDPPLLGVLAGLLSRKWGCRFVYNVCDLYPDIALATGSVRSRFLLKLLAWANRFAFARADAVVAASREMAARIVEKGVEAEKVTVVTNWADCEQLRPLGSASPFRNGFDDKFVVMYSGNIGLSQKLETVLDAADRLRANPRVLFLLIGEGARKHWLERRASAMALPNVTFLPYQPKEKLAESLGAADLHLIPLSPRASGCIVPSKVYGILAVGRPFVAMMEPEAEIALLAKEHAVGMVVAPGDGEGLARAVEHALAMPEELARMGTRARKVAEQLFERKKLTARFGAVVAAVNQREK